MTAAHTAAGTPTPNNHGARQGTQGPYFNFHSYHNSLTHQRQTRTAFRTLGTASYVYLGNTVQNGQ
ncbi:hypothetical protein E2C01_010177 [Portunus trituberculatus]|uniref:Uncharacterized protein n=1 Tax=Portunus trituberculatus TaxID=210409 RepID=A0A5B7D7Z8_PORTR|nr:hypothetical protein [Portunus trituberculatus]